MAGEALHQAWLVAVGWAGEVFVKMGDLGGWTTGNSALQESEPP